MYHFDVIWDYCWRGVGMSFGFKMECVPVLELLSHQVARLVIGLIFYQAKNDFHARQTQHNFLFYFWYLRF